MKSEKFLHSETGLFKMPESRLILGLAAGLFWSQKLCCNRRPEKLRVVTVEFNLNQLNASKLIPDNVGYIALP